ncbi:armadillo-type protein [Schizophyllum commune]
MDVELQQVVQAINIAADPTQQASDVYQQALAYLQSIQQNGESSWRLALHLFVDQNADGTRKYPTQARFFALRVLDDFFDERLVPFDQETFSTLQQAMLAYIQSEYVFGAAEASATFLRNKFSHTLTLFFLCTYIDQWPSFFTDLFTCIRPAEGSSERTFNRHVSLLFFRVMLEISGEVADQLIKTARTFNAERHARDGRVRDAVRERDAPRINEAVLTIVSDAARRMETLRKDGSASRETEEVEEMVDLGIRTFGSYVGWIDINLTVTPTTVPLLFTLLADSSLPIRLATSVSLLRIVSKGLKEPGDKLQLLKILSLGQVIDALETKTREQQIERGTDTDEGEESYREALGKLLNVLGLELMKLIEDTTATDAVKAEANSYLEQILPVTLRFMADEYDDTCNTVFPFLQALLTNYKRLRRASTDPLPEQKRAFLASLVQVILTKLKWDEDAEPEDLDEDENTEFENLRKDLRVFMDSVSVIDQPLVLDAVRTLVLGTFTAYQEGSQIKWNDAELAVYLVYVFGEVNKSTSSKGRAAFCEAPPAVKGQPHDYSQYPLTAHGAVLFAMVQSGIVSYPHRAVSLQYFESVARYPDFFKVRKECIPPTLEAMIDSRGVHNENQNYRLRVYYLFYRFIRDGKSDISPELAVRIINSIRDLLPVEVAPIETEDKDADPLAEAVNNAAFNSHIYLHEIAGMLCSLLYKDPQEQSALLMSLVRPMMDDLSASFETAKATQDTVAIVRVHHIIMALGNIAKGFPDMPAPPLPEGYIVPPLDVFTQTAQAILVCLEAMNVFKIIRDAARFAFARILATTGPNVTHLIPPLMTNLLTHFEPTELVDFLNFIGLLLHKLKRDIFDVLDELIGPLTDHIGRIVSQPVQGTDEERDRVETRRALINMFNSTLDSDLQGVFTSSRNNARFEQVIEMMLGFATDVSDPVTQRTAFGWMNRSVQVWGQPAGADGAPSTGIPGFERFIYERYVPAAFAVPANPAFNPKDGQSVVVLHEIANLLQKICKTRGDEAYNFFLSAFFPSQNWPADTALELTTKMRDLEPRVFRKYFHDFVRSSRGL